MTSNAALTIAAKDALKAGREHLEAIARYRGMGPDFEIHIHQNEKWAAREMVSAVRSITRRHETAGTKMSLALQNEITLAFMELVEYAKANRSVHIIDVLLGNVYTASETLEIVRAAMVPVDETPAPATEEDGDGMSWERDLDNAPKHWSYNDVLEAAVYDPSTECKRTTVTLREGDTAVAMGTTKYEHFGPGVIEYYIRPDGTNARTECPVRHIRK